MPTSSSRQTTNPRPTSRRRRTASAAGAANRSRSHKPKYHNDQRETAGSHADPGESINDRRRSSCQCPEPPYPPRGQSLDWCPDDGRYSCIASTRCPDSVAVDGGGGGGGGGGGRVMAVVAAAVAVVMAVAEAMAATVYGYEPLVDTIMVRVKIMNVDVFVVLRFACTYDVERYVVSYLR